MLAGEGSVVHGKEKVYVSILCEHQITVTYDPAAGTCTQHQRCNPDHHPDSKLTAVSAAQYRMEGKKSAGRQR